MKLLTSKLNNANKDEGDDIPCGEKNANRIRLRSFHDRIFDEPRGKSNYQHLRETVAASLLTHRQRLDKMANDPEILVSRYELATDKTPCAVERSINDDFLSKLC